MHPLLLLTSLPPISSFASYILFRKLRHKNLLEFYGVCLEPEHISLLVEYMPNSGLLPLLADSSFNLNLRNKVGYFIYPLNIFITIIQVKIVKQIAEAMEFLSNQRDNDWLAINGNLKSANVLVSRDTMEVKVGDYGQGNLKDLARTMTSVGTVAWTG
jgi:serine/threonine protein kinase